MFEKEAPSMVAVGTVFVVKRFNWQFELYITKRGSIVVYVNYVGLVYKNDSPMGRLPDT